MAAITPHLRKGETVLWVGTPPAPDSLRAYSGWHTWVARGILVISLIMATIVYANRAELEGLLFAVVLIIGGPIVLALAFGLGVSWLNRKARRGLTYAVTETRGLIVTPTGPMSLSVTPESPIEIVTGKNGQDFVQIAAGSYIKTRIGTSQQTRRVWSAPKGFILAPDDAADAYRALLQRRAA